MKKTCPVCQNAWNVGYPGYLSVACVNCTATDAEIKAAPDYAVIKNFATQYYIGPDGPYERVVRTVVRANGKLWLREQVWASKALNIGHPVWHPLLEGVDIEAASEIAKSEY